MERHLPTGSRVSRVCRNTLECVFEQSGARETLPHNLVGGLHPHVLRFPIGRLGFFLPKKLLREYTVAQNRELSVLSDLVLVKPGICCREGQKKPIFVEML